MKKDITDKELIELYRGLDFSVHVNHEKNLERIKSRLTNNDAEQNGLQCRKESTTIDKSE